MHATFHPAAADHEYVFRRMHHRISARSPLIRRMRRRQLVLMPLMGAMIFFLAFLARPLPVRLVAAGAGAVLGLLMWHWQRRRTLSRFLRAMVAERHPEGTSAPFTVRLERGALVTESMHGTVRTPWSAVAEVDVTDRSVDIWMEDDNLVVMPRHAFADEAEFQRFGAEAERLRGGG